MVIYYKIGKTDVYVVAYPNGVMVVVAIQVIRPLGMEEKMIFMSVLYKCMILERPKCSIFEY